VTAPHRVRKRHGRTCLFVRASDSGPGLTSDAEINEKRPAQMDTDTPQEAPSKPFFEES